MHGAHRGAHFFCPVHTLWKERRRPFVALFGRASDSKPIQGSQNAQFKGSSPRSSGRWRGDLVAGRRRRRNEGPVISLVIQIVTRVRVRLRVTTTATLFLSLFFSKSLSFCSSVSPFPSVSLRFLRFFVPRVACCVVLRCCVVLCCCSCAGAVPSGNHVLISFSL